jgi:hypothetical protein
MPYALQTKAHGIKQDPSNNRLAGFYGRASRLNEFECNTSQAFKKKIQWINFERIHI